MSGESKNIIRNRNNPILIILAVNLIVFLPMIVFVPGFLSDDFYIFSRLKENIYLPISITPADSCYLFLRPVSYFFMWCNYLLWNVNSEAMKITSLVFHIVYSVVVFHLIIEIFRFLKLENDRKVILLIALAIAVHPDSIGWILWICNCTEMLTVLFYAAALYTTLLYLNDRIGDRLYIIGVLGFYILSVTAKQQSLHLPMLILFCLLIFRHRIENSKKKMLIISSLISLFLLISFSAFNYAIAQHNGEMALITWWKKPFSLLGTILYIIFPVPGESLYKYFLVHKDTAIILSIVPISFLLFFRKKITASVIRTAFYVFIFVGIIYFPRIFAVGGDRVNSIQIMWIFIFIGGLVVKYWPHKKYAVLFSGVLFILFNSCYVFYSEWLPAKNNKAEYADCMDLMAIKKNTGKNIYIIIAAGTPGFIPYICHFNLTGEFGKIEGIGNSELFWKNSSIENGEVIIKAEKKDNGTLIIKTLSEEAEIDRFGHVKKLVKSIPAKSGRGFSEVVIKDPAYNLNRNTLFVYHNGQNWVVI